ncbi:hypothetical protein B0H12DRAFT_1235908 [Mycena haematopus]|nr:hypothetical protein B0H12DRAFT_1235908 [Mycena haematopus]
MANPNLVQRPFPDAIALEEETEAIMLSANRDPMLPNLFYAVNHPQMPKPNRCIVFEIDLSPENMRKLKEWEDTQKIKNFATDEELADLGWFELPPDTPVFSREKGGKNAWDDACQTWLTPAEVIPVEVKEDLRQAVKDAMGPPELITRHAPVRDEHGNWSGGILMERGDDRCKPVKDGTRCYTVANSYQSPRELWSPAAGSKVNGSIGENNVIRCNLILAAAPFGIIGLQRGPPEMVKIIENHSSMLNIPPLGLPGNFGYQTMQVNVAPAEPFGIVSLDEALGEFGEYHRDKGDSGLRFW